jgi:plasmid stabilization system protein ParE
VDQIQEFVAQDRPVAAFRLALALIDRTQTLLADNPMAGRRGRAVGTRELVVSGTLNTPHQAFRISPKRALLGSQAQGLG